MTTIFPLDAPNPLRRAPIETRCEPRSRLEQLLLPEKQKEPNTNDQLAEQCNPEPAFRQCLCNMQTEVGKHVSRPRRIRRTGSCSDRRQTPDHLGSHKREDDVEASQRLQEDHAEPDTLHSVEDTQPEPEGAAEKGTGCRSAPGHVDAERGCAPEHLAPSGRAEADGEDREDPGVLPAKSVEYP